MGGEVCARGEGGVSGACGEVTAVEYSPERLRGLLPHPCVDANKYSRGRVVVVAGSAAYAGAACLAAFAAQRMGAGYTEVPCAPESVNVVRGYRPSLVVRSWESWAPAGALLEAPCAQRPCACVVGPGFDARGEQEARLVYEVLRSVRVPVLVDGGALGILASAEGVALARARAEEGLALVLTPHAGEASRLEAAAGISPDATPDATPERRAAHLARAYACTVVLKGSDTYIASPTNAYSMSEGTAALAKAGTGDVLAGMIGALLAQGLSLFDACVLGATLHAHAGNAAAHTFTDISVTPEDVIAHIPHAIRALDAGLQRV